MTHNMKLKLTRQPVTATAAAPLVYASSAPERPGSLTGCCSLVHALSVLAALSSSLTWADDLAKQSALNWYEEVYWPHWEDSAQLDLKDVKPFFSEKFSARSGIADPYYGKFPPPDFALWIEKSREEGWLGDDLIGAKSRRINERTHVIEATIRSNFKSSPEIIVCSWYLLEKSGETWLIASQAWMDCR